MILYGLTAGFDRLHVRYPSWKTWAFDVEPEAYAPIDRRLDDPNEPLPRFGRVFVCHSGAWTPPWCDEAFDAFVGSAPMFVTKTLNRYDRTFDLDAAKAHAAISKDMRRRAEREATDAG